MNKLKEKKIIKFICFSFLLMSLSCLLIGVFTYNLKKDKFFEVKDYNINWISNNKEISLKNIEEDTNVYKIIKEEDLNKDILVSIKSLYLRIYIDEKVVYEPIIEENILGKTPGVTNISFHIDKEDLNKKLTFSIISPYEDGGKFISIIASDKLSNYRYLISRDYIGSCISFAIILISFFALSFIIFVKKKYKIGDEMFFLSLFTLNVGIFLFCDSTSLQMIFGNNAFYHTVTELWMMLPTIPFALFIYKIFNSKDKNILFGVCTFSVLVFFINFFLNLFCIFDLHETVILTHVSYIVTALYTLTVAFKYYKNTKIYTSHVLALFSVIVFSLIDIIINWFTNISIGLVFTRFGLLLFMLIEIGIIINKYLIDYKDKTQMELLAKIAYHDGLTGLYNRTSFIDDMKKLDSNPNNITIVMFDVNDLKITNDKLGHTYGDKLIIEAGKGIKNAFKKYGKVYRIGGDEYVAVLDKVIDEKAINKAIKEMKAYYKTLEEDEFKIAVAVGYSKYDKSKHKDLKATYNEADKLMYENKILIKGKDNIR